MLAIHAVRSSAEIAAIEAYDMQEEKLQQPRRSSLTLAIRQSFAMARRFSQDAVDRDLARSLLNKTDLTHAQKRRLSMEILSQVQMDAVADLSDTSPIAAVL